MSVAMQTSRTNESEEADRLKSVPPPEFAANGQHSIAVKAALAALRIYKVYLSILFAGNCRFQPTCSVYMYEAIERFGVLRGLWMGLKRLLRCQPLSRKFGYDPVPEKAEMIGHTDETSSPARPSNAASREAHS
jgi:putative membrane protein insertion efficiency factor